MQILVNILFKCSTFLIISYSYVFIFNLIKSFYFTHAAIISAGAYLVFLFFTIFNISIINSIAFSLILCLFVGHIFELFFYRYIRNKQFKPFTFIVTSLGLYTIIQNLISLTFGDDTKTLNTNEIVVGHEFFGAYITTIQIITIVVSLVLFIGMFLLYNYTTLGKQIRAVSENPELATVYGISQNKTILICTAISSALAAIAGILYAYDTNLTPTMGFNLLMYGIVAMIIGGVGSFRGLLFGSLLLATAQNLVAYYLDTKWMDAATYVILIAFLLWKPLGFSGKRLKKIEI